MTVEATDSLTDQIREALRLVIDPELGDNIIELGLVYYVAVQDGGVANIVMTTTTRGCPTTEYLKNGAREASRPWRPAETSIALAGSPAAPMSHCG
ncbi:metal-sulfur cluster assembly factor [Mesorhizobium sp. A623]